jgi:nickel transport protein
MMKNKYEGRKHIMLKISGRFLMTIIVLFFLLNFTSSVYAHKVYLFAWSEGETIYVDSYFSGKKKVIGGHVGVFDFSGKKLLEGKTDKNGAFSFKIPIKADLRIVLESSMGHKAEYVFKADELLEDNSTLTSTPINKEGIDVKAVASPISVDIEQIRKVVEEVVDSRLKPVSRSIAKIREEKGPDFTDIMGGFGYILGIVGIALYFKSKEKK